MTLCDFFDHFGHKVRRVRCRVHLADTGDTRVGCQLDENKVPTAKSRRGVAHHKGFYVGDKHVRKRSRFEVLRRA